MTYPAPQYPPPQYPQQQYPPQPQGYPQQPGYPPQQQYPPQPQQQYYPQPQQQYQPVQPGYPVQGYQVPQNQPVNAVAATQQCRFCGCVPAANVTFRGHQGMIVIMRFLRLEGPFCRDCGLSTFRRMTSRTLV